MFEWLWGNAVLKLWSLVQYVSLDLIPGWVWIVIIALATAWLWNKFGWQGLVALGLLVLSAGSYRQGWRDRGSGKEPFVPVDRGIETDDPMPVPEPPPKRRKRLFERFRDK